MDDQIPFILGRTGCHDFSIHPGTSEFDRNKVGVTDIDTEADSRLIFSQLKPATDHIPHQISPAHDFGYLVFLVIAAVVVIAGRLHLA